MIWLLFIRGEYMYDDNLRAHEWIIGRLRKKEVRENPKLVKKLRELKDYFEAEMTRYKSVPLSEIFTIGTQEGTSNE